MSRINTNVTALVATRMLNANNNALGKSLQRLSTGLRINSGADDPAGLIASENLRADKVAITRAMGNAERANSIIATAEGALSELSSMLTKLQDLVGSAANSGGLSQEEIDANQSQVDGIVSTISRIASQTSFEGIKLLDGSMDFEVTNAGPTKVTDLVVNGANLGSATSLEATVTVATAATRAARVAAATTAAADVTVELSGAKGTQVFTFAAGATVAQMVAAVNAVKDTTGLSAKLSGGLAVSSVEYGADQFVTVRTVSGSGFTDGNTKGTDAGVTINGMKAAVDGYKVSLRANNLNVDFTMASTFASVAAGTSAFTVTGGGAQFSLSANVGYAGLEIVGIQSMAAHRLGNTVDGYLSNITTGASKSLGTDAVGAQKIVGAAIKQVATLRGRLGSFQNDTLTTTVNSLQVALENVSAAESAVRDTDFATETSNMTRSQILVNAATSVLAMANSAPQTVLSLLR